MRTAALHAVADAVRFPAVLSYAIDGFVLSVKATGIPSPDERAAVIHAIRSDPAVPTGAVLLLQVEDPTARFDETALRARLSGLIRGLGPKIAPVCAVVSPASR